MILCCFFFFNDTATTEIYTTDTLFPYTTLFRSVGAVAQPSLGEVVAPLAVEELRARLGQRTVGDARGHQALGRAARVLQALAPVNGFGGALFGQLRALGRLEALVAQLGGGDLEVKPEEHTSETQSLLRRRYAGFGLA